MSVALHAGGSSYAPAMARANSARLLRLNSSALSHDSDLTSPRKSVSNVTLRGSAPEPFRSSFCAPTTLSTAAIAPDRIRYCHCRPHSSTAPPPPASVAKLSKLCLRAAAHFTRSTTTGALPPSPAHTPPPRPSSLPVGALSHRPARGPWGCGRPLRPCCCVRLRALPAQWWGRSPGTVPTLFTY
jgi:hypothetical protein